jgi:hypothetical protein
MHRTTVTLMLCGLEIEEKAALFERTLWSALPGGRHGFAESDVQLLRTDRPDPERNEQAWAQLRITVSDPDETKVGRAFTARLTELALASYPGLFSGQTSTRAYGATWTSQIPRGLVTQEVVIDGKRITMLPDPLPQAGPVVAGPGVSRGAAPAGPTRRLPLGLVAGARSGDKGGNATLGIWGRDDMTYQWLAQYLSVERLRHLIPEAAELPVERVELPNLRAVSFVLVGLLGQGVAASTRPDPQAKSLGEYVRARLVDIPVGLLPDHPC